MKSDQFRSGRQFRRALAAMFVGCGESPAARCRGSAAPASGALRRLRRLRPRRHRKPIQLAELKPLTLESVHRP